MKYDIAAKVIISNAIESILTKFLGIDFSLVEEIREIPEETVSLKRSDFPFQITRKNGQKEIVLLEIQTTFSREFVLRLLDYTVRSMLDYNLKVIPSVLLLTPSKDATGFYKDDIITFNYHAIKLWEQKPENFLDDIWLYPFLPLMENGVNFLDEIERKVYQDTKLEIHEKADILTATAIFAGMKDKKLSIELIKRRRDIMIESPVYEIIKEEGIIEGIKKGKKEGIKEGIKEGKKEGLQEAISLGLEIKFGVESLELMDKVIKINSLTKLEMIKEAIKKAKNVDEIENLLKRK
jgi:predicted transposase YdaD